MRPENVNPENFQVFNVVYGDQEFSIDLLFNAKSYSHIYL